MQIMPFKVPFATFLQRRKFRMYERPIRVKVRPGGYTFCNPGAFRNIAFIPNLNAADDGDVAAEKASLSDFGFSFYYAIVVENTYSFADVRQGSDFGITYATPMFCFYPGTKIRSVDISKETYCTVVSNCGVEYLSFYHASLSDVRVLDVRPNNRIVTHISHAFDGNAFFNSTPLSNDHIAFDGDPGMDNGSFANVTLRPNITSFMGVIYKGYSVNSVGVEPIPFRFLFFHAHFSIFIQ